MKKKNSSQTSPVTRRIFLKSTGAISSGIAFAGITSSMSCTNAEAPGKGRNLRTVKNKKICRVTCGTLNVQDLQAVALALEDLRTFWEKAFGVASYLLEDEQSDIKSDLNILIGTAKTQGQIKHLEEQGVIKKLHPVEQGFTLDILSDNGQNTAVLRAVDRLGLQYAVVLFCRTVSGRTFCSSPT